MDNYQLLLFVIFSLKIYFTTSSYRFIKIRLFPIIFTPNFFFSKFFIIITAGGVHSFWW